MALPISTAAIIGGLLMGALSAYLAHRRGKNIYLWFAIGFFFGIFGIMAVFFTTKPKKEPEPLEATKESIAPPVILGPVDKFWYYLDPAHQQQGPMSHDALSLAWREGKIKPETYVWNEELPHWKPLQELLKSATS